MTRSRATPHEDVAARDRRRPVAMRRALVLRRRLPGELAEPGAERAEAREPDQVTDLRHGQVHRPQQLLGPLDPPPGEIAAGALPVRGTEGPDEVIARVARRTRDRVEVERLGVLGIHQVTGPAERGQGDLDTGAGRRHPDGGIDRAGALTPGMSILPSRRHVAMTDRIAGGIGRPPDTSSSVLPAVRGSSSIATSTAATSSRGTSP